jgi:membrane protease subunit HflK
MAWNEPGKGGNQSGGQDGPPDLDKVFKDIADKFNSFFGGKKKSSSGSNGSGEGAVSVKPFIIGGVVIALILWGLSGIFIVSPAERAVLLTFGKYSSTVGPGPHWVPRMIQQETTVNVKKISNYSYSAQMLTKDQNIVDVAVAVQYRISNAREYLYNLTNPDNSMQQATASALRQVMGNTTLDEVLTSGRAVVRQNILEQIEKILTMYNAGIEITDVALQPARAPAEVKEAFDDAIKAQEDEQRYQNQAEAYANGVIPLAQGKSKRITQEAGAYEQQVVLQAQAAVAEFDAIYSVYQNAPKVTRERMYLTAMENVLQHSSKVLVDTKGHNNLMYLPLDKLLAKQSATAENNAGNDSISSKDLAASGVLPSSYTNDSANSDSSSAYVNPDSTVGGGVRP